jgi:Rrf2 family protein
MLSQTAGYAITALGHLGTQGQGQAMFVRDLAEATEIPPSYLAKIVNTLARKGLLSTQRGSNGGVSLARPPEQITLYEICEAFDDPIVRRQCLLGHAECSDRRDCPAHRFWSEARERMGSFLRHTTLRDIARFQERKAMLPDLQKRRGP